MLKPENHAEESLQKENQNDHIQHAGQKKQLKAYQSQRQKRKQDQKKLSGLPLLAEGNGNETLKGKQ